MRSTECARKIAILSYKSLLSYSIESEILPMFFFAILFVLEHSFSYKTFFFSQSTSEGYHGEVLELWITLGSTKQDLGLKIGRASKGTYSEREGCTQPASIRSYKKIQAL